MLPRLLVPVEAEAWPEVTVIEAELGTEVVAPLTVFALTDVVVPLTDDRGPELALWKAVDCVFVDRPRLVTEVVLNSDKEVEAEAELLAMLLIDEGRETDVEERVALLVVLCADAEELIGETGLDDEAAVLELCAGEVADVRVFARTLVEGLTPELELKLDCSTEGDVSSTDADVSTVGVSVDATLVETPVVGDDAKDTDGDVAAALRLLLGTDEPALVTVLALVLGCEADEDVEGRFVLVVEVYVEMDCRLVGQRVLTLLLRLVLRVEIDVDGRDPT